MDTRDLTADLELDEEQSKKLHAALVQARAEGVSLGLSRAAEHVVKFGMTGKEDMKTKFRMGLWLRQRAIEEGEYIRGQE